MIRHRRLEQELGCLVADLDLAALDALIKGGFRESAVVEFKKEPPKTKPDNGGSPQLDKREFSKDLTALANSGGGIILYGIEESRTDPGLAGRIMPVAGLLLWRERIQKAIAKAIQPLPEISVRYLLLDGKEDVGILLVALGESARAMRPYMSTPTPEHNQASFPIRDEECQIRYMDENEVELLYRERFRTYDDRLRRAHEVLETGVARLNKTAVLAERVIWLVQAVSSTYPARLPISPALVSLAEEWLRSDRNQRDLHSYFNRRKVIISDASPNDATSYATRYELHSDGSAFGGVALYPEHFNGRSMNQWRFRQEDLETLLFDLTRRLLPWLQQSGAEGELRVLTHLVMFPSSQLSKTSTADQGDNVQDRDFYLVTSMGTPVANLEIGHGENSLFGIRQSELSEIVIPLYEVRTTDGLQTLLTALGWDFFSQWGITRLFKG